MKQSANRIRVLLADDHPLYVDGVAAAIRRRPEFDLVGVAGDGREALRLIRETEPDVALVDLRMPEISGLDLVKAVRRHELATRVVLVSGVIEPELVYAAVSAGAGGYLLKEVARDEICDATAAVARGTETVLSPAVQQALVAGVMLHSDAATDRPALTRREHEVLELMAEGLTARAIAERLILGEATIKTHQQHIYEKLGVRDRAAAVAAGLRRGILE